MSAQASSSPRDIVAETRNVTKVFGEGNAEVRALDGINLQLERGSFTAIMGPSGSGKSTLMHCMAGLDRPTRGQVLIGGRDISRMDDTELTKVRRDQIGFIFQQFNLLPTLTAQQNIVLPLELAGRKVDKAHFRVIVESLGLEKRLKHRPSELSGGQQQRVAISRALITQPDVIFADEPTGALDSKAGHTLLAYLAQCSKRLGQTIVMVTHDPNAAAYADRALILSDGRIIEDIPRPDVDSTLHALRRLDASPNKPHAGHQQQQQSTAPVPRQLREAIMPSGPGLPRDRSGRDGRDNEETRDLPPALARSLFGNQHRPSAQDLIHTWQEETRGMNAVPKELYDNAPPQAWRGRNHDQVEPQPTSRRDPQGYEDTGSSMYRDAPAGRDPYARSSAPDPSRDAQKVRDAYQSRDPQQVRDAYQSRDPQQVRDAYQSRDPYAGDPSAERSGYDERDRGYEDRRSARSANEYPQQRRSAPDPYGQAGAADDRSGYGQDQGWDRQGRGGFAEVPPPRSSAPQAEGRSGWEPRGGDGQLRSAWQDTEATGWNQSPAPAPAPKHQPSQPYWRFEDRTGQQPAVRDIEQPRQRSGYEADSRATGRSQQGSQAAQSWASAPSQDTGYNYRDNTRDSYQGSGYASEQPRGRADERSYERDDDRSGRSANPPAAPTWDQKLTWANQPDQGGWSSSREDYREQAPRDDYREAAPRDDRGGHRPSADGWNTGRGSSVGGREEPDTFVPSYSSPAFGLGKGFTDLPPASPVYEEPRPSAPSYEEPRTSAPTYRDAWEQSPRQDSGYVARSESSPSAPYYRDLQAPHRALGQTRPSAPNLDGIDWGTPLPEKSRRREEPTEARENYSTPRTWDEEPPAMPSTHVEETRWNGASAPEPYRQSLPKPAASANEWGAQSRSWEVPTTRGSAASEQWGDAPRPRRSAPEPDRTAGRPAPDWDEPRWDDRSSNGRDEHRRDGRYDDDRGYGRDQGWGSQGNDQPRRW